uniref:long-chain-fatty-acid--CoA ligase n=2 Tax=Scylla olivacea TaxID=85551 RepID=A0A0P4W6D2_SCYOL
MGSETSLLPIISKSIMSNLEVIGNYKNGPDQVIPASSFKTWNADGATQVFLSDEEAASYKPKSVYTMLKETAEDYPNHPALAVKRGVWKYWTYKEYFEESKTVAKAFIKLGLDRFHGICIMGFNSPEWVIANYGAVFAGGLSTGVYTTNSPEACRYLADSCDAQIIVVEDVTCLNKFLAVKRFLPSIKAIIQWSGIPGAPGVLSWPELLATGLAEKDTELNERLSLSAVNQCCTLIYTSGTTGPPKGVMYSQDLLIWTALQYKINSLLKDTEECMVSYLPLSHLAAHLLDIYLSCVSVSTVCFAQPDALKGSLLQTLLEVQPTCFMGVPRVWEKMYEKMQEAEASVGGLKKIILSWAKYHGLNYYNAIRDGRYSLLAEVVDELWSSQSMM